jgi:DoxX-like family
MFKLTVAVTVLIALAAAGSAIVKLTKQPKLIESLAKLGVPLSWLPLLAAAELAGAVGVLLGLRVPALGIAAGIGLVLYFIGAVISHVRKGDRGFAPPLVLTVIAALAVVLRISTT